MDFSCSEYQRELGERGRVRNISRWEKTKWVGATDLGGKPGEMGTGGGRLTPGAGFPVHSFLSLFANVVEQKKKSSRTFRRHQVSELEVLLPVSLVFYSNFTDPGWCGRSTKVGFQKD